jgi:hypothetical protein
MLQNYSFYSISAIFYYGFLCKNTHSHISTSTLQLFMCASDVKYFAVFFSFSQYYSLTLHSQRFATLPLETPYRGAVRLKGNGVRVPDCPAAVSRPYLRARTREPLKPCISVLSAWVWQDAIPSYALGRCSRLGGESEDLPKLICRWSHRRAPRGLGAYDRNTYII